MADEPRSQSDAPRGATGEQEWTAPLMHALRGRDSKVLQAIFNSLKTELKRIKALAEAGGGGGATDHGALTGLGDDDHTQYLNAARHQSDDHSIEIENATPDNVDFDTTATLASEVGRLTWNNGEGTLDLGLKGGNVTLSIGQEMLALCYNGTGSTISRGQVVRVNGAQGQRPSVALAQANNEANSTATFGVAAENIANGAEGFVATQGIIKNVDTSLVSAGAALWLSPSTAGGFTSTKPSAPDHLVFVGWALKSHVSSGEIYIKNANGFELEELHNVQISSPATDHYLYYDASTSLWKHKAFPTSLPPSGAAGGDLTGTYPNPTLGAVGTAGTYTKVTTDSKGRVTAGTTLVESDIPSLSPTKITGTAVITTDARLSDSRTPTGAASGDLTGTYPGPTLAATGTAGTYTKVTTDSKGRVTSGTNAALDDLSDVVITTPANGQALQYNGTNWVNATPSTGVTDHGLLTGLGDDDHTQYFNSSRHDSHDHSTALGSTVLADISNVSSTAPSTNQVLKWNGTAWAPAADTDTTYSAGTGLKLTSTTFSTELDGARIERTANLSIANNSFTAVTVGSEVYDTSNYHSTSTNTSRMVTPRAGKYLMTACIEYAANATGVRAVGIRLNGATYLSSQSTASLGSILATTVSTSVVYDLASGDYVEMMAYQTSGGALNALAGAQTHFSITYLGS